MKNCWLTLAGCAFLLLLGATGTAQAADLPAAPEIQTSPGAETPAATPEAPKTLDALFTFDEALSSRVETACTSYEWRCAGTDCGGYGHGERRCKTGGSWEPTPICC